MLDLPVIDESRQRTAGAASLLVGLLGIVGSLYLFVDGYEPLIEAEFAAGSPSEAFVVTYVFPLLTDLGSLAAVGLLVAAYGFFSHRGWAWFVAVTSTVVGLMPNFFQMIPPVSRGLFPVHVYLFVPFLLMYCFLLIYVRPVGGLHFAVSFFTGIAYVLTFMNGIAGINRIVEIGSPIYVATQQLNWASAVCWAVFTVALLYRARWVLPVGLAAGLLGIVGGTPLAVLSTLSKGRFSMFTPAPALSLVLLAVILVWERRLWVTEETAVEEQGPA